MGTTYTVKFLSRQDVSTVSWQERIDRRLQEINTRLSIFDPQSEVSRFNRHPVGQAFNLSRDFCTVLSRAREIHMLTGGALDVTVKPLVDLWGFGVDQAAKEVPGGRAVAEALARTGFHKLDLDMSSNRQPKLTARVPGLQLDLGSIGKGYGVDALARLLADAGVTDYLVEIGGEFCGAGKNQDGRPWSIGIRRPDRHPARQGPFRVVALDHGAIATSGDYSNYFSKGRTVYSHIIHPQTGYPVRNRAASVSVTAPDCTVADGLATALMGMDIQGSLDLVNRLDGVECLIIQKQEGEFRSFASRHFGHPNRTRPNRDRQQASGGAL
jgi:thiamine biosynthesis lipoprotein